MISFPQVLNAKQQHRLLSALLVCSFLFVAIGLLIWAYWPGLDGPALLDDRINLPQGGEATASWSAFFEVLLANDSGPLGRPISILSFVAEQWFWDDSIRVGKGVNLAIHALNSVLVFFVLAAIYRRFFSDSSFIPAMLATLVWSWSPLQLSTVLYHVQRMALLSTTFILVSIIAVYTWQRRIADGDRGFPYLFVAIVSATLAVLSKENALILAILIPLLLALTPSVAVAEYDRLNKKFVQIVWVELILCLAGFLLALDWVLAGYNVRDFGFSERILTQPRVIADYAVQFVFPNIRRLGLFHDDFVISQSLFNPMSTFFSIGSLGCLLAFGFLFRSTPWGKLWLLGVSLFLSAHLIESSVLALEMYFEHRNYFPSLGLAIVLMAAIAGFNHRFKKASRPVSALVLIYAISLLSITGSQAILWSNRTLFIVNEHQGHPSSPRANRAMALLMAGYGDLEMAIQFVDAAYSDKTIERQVDLYTHRVALSCIAGKPLPRQSSMMFGSFDGQLERSAFDALSRTIDLVHDQHCERGTALGYANEMLDVNRRYHETGDSNPLLLLRFASLENALGRYKLALWYVEEALKMTPANIDALLMQYYFCSAVDGADSCEHKLSVLLEYEREGQLNSRQSEVLRSYLTPEIDS